jgi:preprotein translocase subunit SecF
MKVTKLRITCIFVLKFNYKSMRIFALIVLIAMPFVSYGQSDKSVDLQTAVRQLEAKNNVLNKRISELEDANFRLKSDVESTKADVQAEIRRSQELQAQNERAMNLALDGFTKKFEDQNKVVQGVQDELGRKIDQQLIIMIIGILVVIIIFLVLNNAATKKALKQNVANWNNFQEHLLKK